MLGLGNSITSSSSISETAYPGATKFASFNGTSSKAVVADPSALVSSLKAAGGEIGQNITYSMWIKATWEIPNSPADSETDVVPFWFLGNDSDVHEGMRSYYSIEVSGVDKNQLFVDLRSTAPSNRKYSRYVILHSSGTNQTATGSTAQTHEAMWRSGNTNINTNSDGFVHIAVSRSTAGWKIYWNGTSLGVSDNGSDTITQDDSLYNSFSLGHWEYANSFAKMGMRDFAIYGSQLTDGNISTLYHSGTIADVRTLLTEQPQVYYPLEADGADMINGLNMTLTNVTFTTF